MTGRAWLIGAAGGWLAVSPFLGFVPRETPWNDLAVGIIVGILGVKTTRAKPAYGWIAVALGGWLAGVALLPPVKAALGAVWHDIVVGAVLVILGFVGVSAGGSAPVVHLFPPPPREPQHRH